MPLPVFTAATAAPIVKDAVLKGFLTISREISTRVDKHIQILNTETKARRLFTKIYNVRKVKTLWQMDKPVDLTTFYHTPKLRSTNGAKREVRTIKDIGADKHIVVLGIAGQGKSMLMRQLCITELAKGINIPLFIELRNISTDCGMYKLIENALDTLDISTDPRLLDYLFRENKLCLLLDGFDEIIETQLTKTVREIELLSDKYPELNIIISSRPGSGTEGFRNFSTAFLCDLEGDEYQAVLQPLLYPESMDLYDELIKKIKANKNQLNQFLTTPLMVTLLLVKYKAYKEIPQHFTDFYDGILEVLLSRHDRLKPGYSRKRESALSDREFRTVFETLTFKLTKLGVVFSEDRLQEICNQALIENKQKCRPESFIGDLVKITCLLLKDGRQFRFIHKSVQEYYAAAYISKKSEAWKSSFFDNVYNKGYLLQLKPIIQFLKEMDPYSWNAFFNLPMLKRFVGGYIDNSETLEQVFLRVFGPCKVSFGDSQPNKPFSTGITHSLLYSYLHVEDAYVLMVIKHLTSAIKKYYQLKDIPIPLSAQNILFADLIAAGCCTDMYPDFEKCLVEFRERLVKAEISLKEATESFKGF